MTRHKPRFHEMAVAYDTGLLSPSDGEILTLVLCPAGRPSKRIAHIVHRIMNTGGLQGLAQELTNAPVGLARLGLSAQEIKRLTMAYELIARCNRLHRMSSTQIRSVDDAVSLFQPEMMHLDHEEMHVLILDSKNQVIEYARPYKGTVNGACVRIAEIFRPAVLRNCPHILVCHNHPSRCAQSSLQDREVTYRMVHAGKLLDIELLDHLIIGNPSYTSLKAEMQW
jgi:DNA repair protein RadC